MSITSNETSNPKARIKPSIEGIPLRGQIDWLNGILGGHSVRR
jgi:hypothetical protein